MSGDKSTKTVLFITHALNRRLAIRMAWRIAVLWFAGSTLWGLLGVG